MVGSGEKFCNDVLLIGWHSNDCRWKLPPAGSSVLASTANELRQDRYTHANPEKLKAAADGLANGGSIAS